MITPDQAQTLLDGATPGPWKKRRDRDGTPIAVVVSAGPTDRHHIMTAEPACSEERAQADTGLIAAAPALAQTIAGMRWEYAVEHLGHVSPWGSRESAEDDLRYYLRTSMFIPHLVRRLVGPAEPIAKETQND